MQNKPTQLTYDERAIEYMKPDLARLLAKLHNCRIDMHEPDEQEITAIVTGTHLDNAMGDNPNNNCCEFTVGIGNMDGNDREWFNLASLIALARLAKLD